jgi:hypothetical protein
MRSVRDRKRSKHLHFLFQPTVCDEFAAVAPIEEEEELPPGERLKIVIVSSEVPCCPASRATVRP